MADFTEFESYDGLGLAELVKTKAVTPDELLDAAIDRAGQINPHINAIVTEMYDYARSSIVGGLPEGAFTGVPFLLKDLRAFVEGVPSSYGSRFFADFVPDHNSEIVNRYLRAGAVIFGRTNTPELGSSVSTEPQLFGPTRNPWNLELIAGGSSGGAAAAVAARLAPMAHGSDGGGSIRIPAACCGVFGLKPTRGRNPMGPDYGESWSGLSAEHALTRSVRDSAAMLDATSGPDVGDPYWAPPQPDSFLAAVGQPPGRLRIAVSTETASGTPIHPDCVEATEAAAQLCEELGHDVVDAAPEYDSAGVGEPFRVIVASNVMASIQDRASALGREPGPDDLETAIGILARLGLEHTAADYARALQKLHRESRHVARFYEQYDAFLTPTLATPPPPLGSFSTMTDDVDAYLSRLFAFIPFTALSNVTGQPSMSVPLSWNDDGTPIGVHFVGRFGDEATLFMLAGQLEEAVPWAHRIPEIANAGPERAISPTEAES